MPTVETLTVIARVLETPIGDLCNEPAKPSTGIELKKHSIWQIAERLELLDEAERSEVLAHINRMIAENGRRRQGDYT